MPAETTETTDTAAVELSARLEHLEATVRAIGAALEGHTAWLRNLHSDAETATQELARLSDAIGQVGSAVAGTDERLAGTEAAMAAASRPVDERLAAAEAAARATTDRMAAAETAARATADRMAGAEAATHAVDERLAGATAQLTRHAEWLSTLERWVSSCIRVLSQLGEQPLDTAQPSGAGKLDPVGSLRHIIDIWTSMNWIENAAIVPETPLVSVIMPTYDRGRAGLLRRAIASVCAQRHPAFELLVIDNGEDSGAVDVVASFGDPRVRYLSMVPRGLGAALNLGLAEARGEIIAFLDDDNLMHPLWLRSVVWAFEQKPDAVVLYGARIIEDAAARERKPSVMMPIIDFHRYDRRRHERANFIDVNTIAHRAGARTTLFDEELPAGLDWDRSLRLMGQFPPMELPAIACFYGTLSPDRISDTPDRLQAVRRVRARAHLSRPLRVLVYTEMYPVISETYIRQDIEALQDCGAEVAVCADKEAASWQQDPPPFSRDFDAAVAAAEPDLILVPWATFAHQELARLEAAGIPFAVRVHSFDMDPVTVARIQHHPLCIGIWAYPHHVPLLPGTRPLPPAITGHITFPTGQTRRPLVISVSAGLPKRDWPTLLAAMDRLGDFERLIVMGRTNDFESFPAEIEERAAALAHPVEVAVNLPHPQVLARLAQSSVMLYTLDPDRVFGMPMSIIEAMISGVVVVTPERPEARELLGEHVRGYRTIDDIVRHVREVMAGGELVTQAREDLRRRGLAFTDPALCRRLHDELAEALRDWKLKQN
jgi:uncharacterized protein YukE